MEKVSINLMEIGDKARSKSELYKILTVEGALYLLPYKFCSVDFMADIIEWKRKTLESKDVIMHPLPHITGLRTENLLEFVIEECNAEEYLPPKYNEVNLYRECVGNICNSLQPDRFHEFVKNKLSSRQKSIITNKKLSLDVVPKFAELFRSSLMISTHKGKSNLMLNRSKRIERENKETQDKRLMTEKEELIDKLQREVNLLRSELDLAYDIQQEADKNAILLEKLYANDVIDEEGNPKNINNHEQDQN